MGNKRLVYLVNHLALVGSSFGAGLTLFDILFKKKPKNPI
jgi:hypothetical protein